MGKRGSEWNHKGSNLAELATKGPGIGRMFPQIMAVI